MADKKQANVSPLFFFPYHDVSGVPVLFARLAKFLTGQKNLDICVGDYQNGAMAKILRGQPGIKFMPFEDRRPFFVSPDKVLVVQSILPYTMRSELRIHPETRIVFWTLHHMNLIPTIVPLLKIRHLQVRYSGLNRFVMDSAMRSLRNKLRRMIHIMAEKKSLFFMDGSTFNSTMDRMNLHLENPIFLPVPCDVPDMNGKMVKNRRSRKTGISVAWVGRLADFKVHILIYTINQLSQVAEQTKIPIEMHIIGYGPEAGLIRKINLDNSYFHLIIAGTRTGQDLDDYLLDKIDVLTAMGTSALEGARLGLPTILLDASYGAIKKGYKFKWIYETKCFSLADMIDGRHYEKGNLSLAQRIDEVLEDYDAVSNKCYEYCQANHSLSSIGSQFVDLLRLGTFRYKDFDPRILRKGPVRLVYEYGRKRIRANS